MRERDRDTHAQHKEEEEKDHHRTHHGGGSDQPATLIPSFEGAATHKIRRTSSKQDKRDEVSEYSRIPPRTSRTKRQGGQQALSPLSSPCRQHGPERGREEGEGARSLPRFCIAKNKKNRPRPDMACFPRNGVSFLSSFRDAHTRTHADALIPLHHSRDATHAHTCSRAPRAGPSTTTPRGWDGPLPFLPRRLVAVAAALCVCGSYWDVGCGLDGLFEVFHQTPDPDQHKTTPHSPTIRV